DGAQTRTFAYVEDAVRATVQAGLRPEAEGLAINVGSEDEVSILDLAERMVRISGSPSRVIRVPQEAVYERGYEDIPRRGRALRPSFRPRTCPTNALRPDGFRTLLTATLLPSRPVGAGAPALLRQIAGEGHELAIHGWDHVGWQDRIPRLDAVAIRADLTQAARAFEAAVGVAPPASAAPGWRRSD